MSCAGHDHTHSHDHAEAGHSHDLTAPAMITDDHSELSEREHFSQILSSFVWYEAYAMSAVTARWNGLQEIPKDDFKLLHQLGVRERLDGMESAVKTNMNFVAAILQDSGAMFNDILNSSHTDTFHTPDLTKMKPSDENMSKVLSTLKQFVRDWSVQGQEERDSSYGPMLQALEDIYATTQNKGEVKVLIPGCGLGRLPFEVSRRGFRAEGNEFSYHMLLASFLMLNRCQEINEFELYPYVHSLCNVRSTDLLLEKISIPDACPSKTKMGPDFALIAGDFTDVYSKPQERNAWDTVMTCFFIDTAKNIVEYIRTIRNCLKVGGKWIQNGPLLWHFDSSNDPTIELTLNEVKSLVVLMGFEIEQEREIECKYADSRNGMLNYTYKSAFWVATKLADAAGE